MKRTGPLLCVGMMCESDRSSKIKLDWLQIVGPDGYWTLPIIVYLMVTTSHYT